MQKLIVKKRDGNEEDWSKDKIITSMVKAGCSMVNAQVVEKNIFEYFLKNSPDGIITSENIKNVVIEEMSKIDSIASEEYKAFKKP